MAIFSCRRARLFIPRAAVCSYPLQNFKMAILSCYHMSLHPMGSHLLLAHFRISRLAIFSCTSRMSLHSTGSRLPLPTAEFQDGHFKLQTHVLHPTGSHLPLPTSEFQDGHLQLHKSMSLHPTDSHLLLPTSEFQDGHFQLHKRTSLHPMGIHLLLPIAEFQDGHL